MSKIKRERLIRNYVEDMKLAHMRPGDDLIVSSIVMLARLINISCNEITEILSAINRK